MINGRWTSFGDVVKLCDVVYYLGRNKIVYRCNDFSRYHIPTVRVYDLDIKFKSNKQLIAFKKRFG